MKTCTCCGLPTKQPVLEKQVEFKEYERDRICYRICICFSCAITIMPFLIDCLIGSEYKNFILKYGTEIDNTQKNK